MSIVNWIIIGIIAGFVASKLIIRSGEGLARDLGLGIAGAVIAGGIFVALVASDPSEVNVFGLVVTLAGASAALIVYHSFFRPIAR